MKRKLPALCAAVSRLACVALCVLWARSLGHRSYTYWVAPERSVEVTAATSRP